MPGKQMNQMLKVATAALAVLVMAGSVDLAHANCAKVRPSKPGEVYFMRGLANIFSLGLDEFSKEVTSLGVENCVYNHAFWEAVVNDIVERSYQKQISYPIIIVGHSLGANIAPLMATRIGKHSIPVRYVAMLDPVDPTVVGANVVEIVNYYLPHRKDNILRPNASFTGQLENVNVKQFGGFDHFNIDEKRNLRNKMKQRIVEVIDEELQMDSTVAQ
ncbi:MAG: hypothetical protein WBO55_12655 [Rhizobiaceae bacterium]